MLHLTVMKISSRYVEGDIKLARHGVHRDVVAAGVRLFQRELINNEFVSKCNRNSFKKRTNRRLLKRRG